MRAPCAAAWLLASAIVLSGAPRALAESPDAKSRPEKATPPETKAPETKAPETKAPETKASDTKPAKPKTEGKRVEPRRDAEPSPKEPAKPRATARDDSPPTTKESPRPKKDPAPKEAPKQRAAKEPLRELAAKEQESKAAVPAKIESEPAPAPAIGPRAGAGDRHVSAGEVEAPPEPKPAKKAEKAERAPKTAETPPAREPGTPDADARRAIAGGPTVDDLNAAKNDPELRELSLAERALFPRPLRGVQAGWSFDAADDGAASVEATGLPPGFSIQPATPAKDSAKEAEWLRSLTMPNLPTRLDARVVKYLKFYRDDPRGKSILRVWAKKCGRLVPALKVELAKAGMPTDLIWLSLIESGHNPTIVSAAGAAGLWQFVPESGRMYGLTVDRWVDERLDPQRSTEAAIRYLSDLRTRFGSWELAMAAYNMGHGGLLRAVRKFNTNDFWALSRYEAGLPWETTLYVPKILATAIAMTNRKAFGIDDIVQDPAIAFDTVFVGPNTDLGDVARAADSPLADVRELNAVYLSGRTPPAQGGARRWPVRVPAGHGLVAEQRLATVAHPSATPTEVHVVRFGDTLESIALEYGTTARELAELNHCDSDRVLPAGCVLLVGSVAKLSPKDAAEEEPVVVPARRFATPDKSRVFYRVRPGDALSDVAAAFAVSPSELVLWNGLDPSAELQQGMTLQVFVRPDADLSRVRHLAERDAHVLVAGTEEFFEYFENQNGRKRFTVVVKKGDTLAGIGKRYGMSTTMMERINRLPSSRPLVPGEKIVVYSKQAGVGVDAAEPDLARQLSAIVAPMPDVLPPLAPPSTTTNGLRTVAQ